MTSTPAALTTSSEALFAFSGDGGGGTPIASFRCAVDGAAPAPCTSPFDQSGFADGSHTFAVAAVDAAGNADQTPATFMWTVDTTPPVFTVPANLTVEATGPGGAAVAFSVPATATDNIDGAGVDPVLCDAASGALFHLGLTTVTCRAQDRAGNAAVASFTITVRDTTAPTLSLPGTVTVVATSPAGANVVYSVSAVDAVEGVTAVVCVPTSGTVFPIGMTTVSCATQDTRGNAASGAFQIVVTPPMNVGLMIGLAELDTIAVRNQFVFVIGENSTGGEAGGIEYVRTTSPFGRPVTTDVFVSTQISSVAFYDAPGTTPGPGVQPPVDQVTFSGAGTWNGQPGYTFTVQATDAGEPGPGRDQFAIVIRNPAGTIVAIVSGRISAGNIESVKVP